VSKGELTRHSIIDRAMRVVTKLGLEGLTIGRLAQLLDMSKSGLYAHFGSKEQLQHEIIWAAREKFVETVVRPALRSTRGVARVRALFEKWVEWGRQPGGCIFVQLAVELDDQPGPAREAVAQAQRDWLAAIATAAQIAIDEGHFSKDVDPEQFAFELYGLMLGFHLSSRLIEDKRVVARIRTAFERLLMDAERKQR
jgi:AcrR family transcriptional regulator